MKLDVLLNNEQARKAAATLFRESPPIHLENITFVGAMPKKGTITTLASTFPEGELRFEQYHITQAEKALGKSCAQIANDHDWKLPRIRNYFYTSSPRSVQSVEAAEKEGILPLNYTNPNITALNTLFALNFWTGCINQGLVAIVPNEQNRPALEAALNHAGYHHEEHKDNAKAIYTVHEGMFYLQSSILARTFALLGLPFRQGHKANIKNFDIPWYMDCMFSEPSDTIFDDASQEQVNIFRRQCMYALLSDKTNALQLDHDNALQDAISLNLMGTQTQALGKKLTNKVSRMLHKVFGLELSKEHMKTFPKAGRNTYVNRLYVPAEQHAPLLKQLHEGAGERAYLNNPLHMKVRSLAGKALERTIV
jgi:hypothetical protein